MNSRTLHRLPAPLEAAAQHLKLAARGAVERSVESLGLAALAAGNAFQRDGLLGAQFELNRKSAVFVLTFNDVFDQRVMREAGALAAEQHTTGPQSGSWDSLSLVEDQEVEAQISAERFGMDVAHSCDWELREFNAYVAALLHSSAAQGETDRNPLRPDVVGHAMLRAVDAVSDRPETRKLLTAEIGRSLRGMLRGTYAAIVADLRNSGVQPMGMGLRSAVRRTVPATTGQGLGSGHADSGSAPMRHPPHAQHARHPHAADGEPASRRFAGSGFAPSTGGGAARSGLSMGQVDPALMSLIRRLAYVNAADGGDSAPEAGIPHGHADFATGGAGPMPPHFTPNLIHAHRDALRQASTGSLDHMVIDVVAGLFDQILSDPKVPPQMARQIGRLQLPVLRAALGDTSFFSSRRHPVRRFINRIASLGASFEDAESSAAQRLLAKVKALVQDVVDGDFDQVETYEQQLRLLEAFVAELSREAADPQGQTTELLSQKEDERRLRQLYAQRLEGDLKGLAGPEFVRDFLVRTWTHVLLQAARQGGPEGALAQRLRQAGRDLFMSVQPKASPAARKAFLAELPRLMQDLTDGMNLVGWPDAQRRAFFGQLMPAHAEALKNVTARALDINLLARQVDSALQRPVPSHDELAAARNSLPVLDDSVESPLFTAEEARRVGLVDEAAVDWSVPAAPPAGEPARAPGPGPGARSAAAAQVDIDLDLGPDVDIDIDLETLGHVPSASGNTAQGAEPRTAPPAAPGVRLPAEPTEPAEPTQGQALADHVQIGFAYQMQLQGQWQKVRLAHVSTGRSFFVFTHGGRHTQTISLTHRMLVRLCAAGRLRAFENAYLIERATERARRQLSGIRPARAAAH